MTQAAASDSEPFEGGPPQHLARFLGLGATGAPRPRHAVLLSILIGWVPLGILVASQDAVLGAGGFGSFAGDFAVHARSLVAVPLLVLADAVCAPRLGAIIRHFLDAGLVEGPECARFEAAVASTRGRVRSAMANAALLGLAYLVSLGLLLWVPSAAYPDWHLVGPGADGADSVLRHRSIAGWWHALVSLPLLLLLMLGWLWRLWLWARMLWLISRMQLRLVPSHPDRSAGLRFVGYSLRAFAIVAFAIGSVAAGRSLNNLVHFGMMPLAQRSAIVAGTIVVVLLFLAPLLVFTPRLLVEWRRGVLEYGALADRLGRQLERRWLQDGRAAEAQGLESGDFSAVADVYQIAGIVHGMRLVPVDVKSILLLAAAAASPFIPLALLSLPLGTILRALARFLV